MRYLPLMLLLALPGLAWAEIYRCETDQGLVFSDQPCDERAGVYQPVRQISVIEPAADLDRIAEHNREFVRQRLDRQAAVREARAQQARPEPQPQYATPREVTRVLYLPEPPPRHRQRRGKPPPQTEHPPPTRDPQQFSALRGPFPGTRRDRDR